MFKYLLFFFLYVHTFASQELPQTFVQLSSPLYKSSVALQKISHIQGLKTHIDEYIKKVDGLVIIGFRIDKTQDKKEINEYLKELRKLQKQYDFILHNINASINTAIDKKDYELFTKLTSYEFDGLLKSRALLDKSLKFYNQHRDEKKIQFFETKIEHKKIEVQTTREFYNVASHAEYSSTNTNSDKNKKVSIEVQDQGNSLLVNIQNNNPYTITVRLKAKYTGLEYDKSVRHEFAIKANTKKEYIRLYKKRGAISYSYSYKYTWIVGSLDAVHDDSYIYKLPYAKGTRHRVSQGYNGTVTHKGHSQYAIDFAMDIGTRIYAIRDGKVVKTKKNSNQGGYDRKYASSGNYITIEHSDTTFAIYYHLKKNGVSVQVGDKVKQGTPIGYSGNTGYSSGPHLHLAVFKASNATRTQSLPISLLSEEGLIITPKKGKFYTAK